MIEFSCPNTNKPLHLGHLRNDAIGASLARIIATAGATVRKVNLINDRGVHICKSMLAYKLFGGSTTPSERGDQGRPFRRRLLREVRAARQGPSRGGRAGARDAPRLGGGGPEVVALWKQDERMGAGGYRGELQADRHHLRQALRESDIYKLGRAEILSGIEKVFSRRTPTDRSGWISRTREWIGRCCSERTAPRST